MVILNGSLRSLLPPLNHKWFMFYVLKYIYLQSANPITFITCTEWKFLFQYLYKANARHGSQVCGEINPLLIRHTKSRSLDWHGPRSKLLSCIRNWPPLNIIKHWFSVQLSRLALTHGLGCILANEIRCKRKCLKFEFKNKFCDKLKSATYTGACSRWNVYGSNKRNIIEKVLRSQ